MLSSVFERLLCIDIGAATDDDDDDDDETVMMMLLLTYMAVAMVLSAAV